MFLTFRDRRTYPPRSQDADGRRIYLDFVCRRVACSGCGVRPENLDRLGANAQYTKGFARIVGRDGRTMPLEEVA